MSIVLGAIADDFTGATDLANTWVKAGVRVVQVIGVPGSDIVIGDADAVVVALKSRTNPAAEAIQQSLTALDWLLDAGARQIVFKYCSTFDSTEHGNIGPVADALLEKLDTPSVLVCPAFPENGRTVREGHLFVGDDLLSDSPMKDHPLTPMRDSNLARLIEAQGSHNAGWIPLSVVHEGPDAVRAMIKRNELAGCRYQIADATTDEDLVTLGHAAKDHALVTGGSGIGMGLPDNLRRANLLGDAVDPTLPHASGRALVVAGSCSTATRQQIEKVAQIWPTRKLSPDGLANDPAEIQAAIEWARQQPASTPVLIYSSADPAEVAQTQLKYGVENAGKMVEEALTQITVSLADAGFDRIIVAGGETSGAVTSGLGVQTLRIGPEIAPGVPWTETTGQRTLAIALKSGNFGGPRFFEDALGMLS